METKANRNILITGASGFIGFHLALEMSKLDFVELFLVDNHIRGEYDPAFKSLCAKSNVSYMVGDLRDAQFVQSLPDVDVIFHFAALNGTQNFYSRPWDVFDNSLRPTILLLDKYSSCKNLKFIYAGTSESYADAVTTGVSSIPTLENTPVMFQDLRNPRWSYGFAKTAGEVAIHSMAKQIGLKFQILRLHNIYGPRMGYEHVVPDLIRKQMTGNGEILGAEQSRSFLYISDAIDYIMKLAETPIAFGQTINIGSSAEIKIVDLAKLIAGLVSFHGTFKDIGAPPGSVVRRVPDLTKLATLITFQEEVSLQEGLAKTVEYFRQVDK